MKMISDAEVEKEVQEKGLTAPRVSLMTILGFIASETYQRITDTTVTVCLLKMKNGYSVVGYSAAVSTANFNEELGRKVAKQKAVDQCWALFGFHLACEQTGETPLPREVKS